MDTFELFYLQEVDMMMFRKYGDLTDEELTQNPLIVLSCGHAFLKSTLDGHMGITEFYEQDTFKRSLLPLQNRKHESILL